MLGIKIGIVFYEISSAAVIFRQSNEHFSGFSFLFSFFLFLSFFISDLADG